MRTAFLQTVEALAAEDPRICLVVGDLGFSVVERFAERFPRQFLNAGVAEQNMTGVAAGMALSGHIVFTYSIANFPTLRCLEQIRNDGCYHKANLKVVSVGGGFAYGALGASHHATEDLAVMRALPGMVVLAPGDPAEAAGATRAAALHPGVCYLRLGKAGEPAVHAGPVDFRIGRAIPAREGTDATLIATGGMLLSCVRAADALRPRRAVRVLSMPSLKPLDAEAVCRAAAETAAIVTVEEHGAIGGLGSAVAEVLAQQAPRRVPFRILGLPDRFCGSVGGQEYLRNVSGLSPGHIASALESLLSDGRPA